MSGSVWKGQRAAHSPGRACRHRGRPEKRARTVSRTWPRSLVDLGREENEKASSINCFHPLSITPTPHRSITKARRRKISGQEIYTAVSVNGLLLFLFLSLSLYISTPTINWLTILLQKAGGNNFSRDYGSWLLWASTNAEIDSADKQLGL